MLFFCCFLNISLFFFYKFFVILCNLQLDCSILNKFYLQSFPILSCLLNFNSLLDTKLILSFPHKKNSLAKIAKVRRIAKAHESNKAYYKILLVKHFRVCLFYNPKNINYEKIKMFSVSKINI